MKDLQSALDVLRDVETHLEAGQDVVHRAEVSDWTVGQQLLHVCMVASSIATAVNRLVRRGGDDARGTAQGRAILMAGKIPRGVATAPPGLSVDAPPAAEEIRAALDKARSRWEGLASQPDAIEAAKGTLPHPFLGPFKATQWVRFAGVHGRHHLAIVDDILEADAQGR